MSQIQFKNISFSYHVDDNLVPVLDNMNLSIEKGEMLAIKGPSGSGKSTFMNLIAGLLTPDSGTIELEGRSITSMSSDQLAILRSEKIGFIFQQFHLVPRNNVIQNILLPTLYPCELEPKQSNSKNRAIELANQLGLGAHTHHFPNQLSGGQQQRVAIARSLINEPEIILADEPTGNLDSKTTNEILETLKELNSQGKTVVIITHEEEVAAVCKRRIEIRDGKIVSDSSVDNQKDKSEKILTEDKRNTKRKRKSLMGMLFSLFPMAFLNLKQNKIRSMLTMLGITIGIASVLSMITLGQFTKRSILSGYEAMGVNRLVFWGIPNWRMKATDKFSPQFNSFNVKKDIDILRKIFPEIKKLSPILRSSYEKVNYAGNEMESIRTIGVNTEYFSITNRNLILGSNFAFYHIENKSQVCIIGHGVAARLFKQSPPIHKLINITNSENSISCKIIGVLSSKTTNDQWEKPDQQIFLPYTYLKMSTSSPWEAKINSVIATITEGSNVEDTGMKIREYFVQKYGNSGHFEVNMDDVMVSQLRNFLNIFSILLTSIALISLLVGGIGITNMMLVSVAERFREIGLRKALGATNKSIRLQFLIESTLLCFLAGIIGIGLGFIAYEGILYGASRLSDKVTFQWLFEPMGFVISFICIFIVGIFSGIMPALKAEKLQVIDALRSE